MKREIIFIDEETLTPEELEVDPNESAAVNRGPVQSR